MRMFFVVSVLFISMLVILDMLYSVLKFCDSSVEVSKFADMNILSLAV